MLGRAPVDEPQELDPLDVAVPRLAHRDHAAVERVERREQRGRAMALVVVGDGAGTPALHRQARLRAVQGLDLALLVAAEHQGVLGRVHVQAHHVQQLVLEARIARELEAATQMRLEPVALPDTAHGRRARAQVLGQRAGAPVGGVDRPFVQRDVHDARLQLGRHRGWASRARRVLAKRIDATVQEALAPQRHLASIQTRLHGNVLVLPPLGGQQDHECSLLEPGLHSSTFDEHTQFPLGVLVQFNRLGNSHRSSLLRDWRRPPTISS
jgi:hypothetical protein